MNNFIKTVCLLPAIALTLALTACKMNPTTPERTAAPSLSPEASASAEASPSLSPSPSPSPLMTDEASPSPAGSEDAGGTAEANAIPGFMEGSIVDPADVPELMAQLSEHADYKDMTVQSITYKLYEGRQAYYVVLQGEGEAAHPVYVFADGSIIDGVE